MKKCPKCGMEYPDANTLCPADGVALEKTGDPLVGKVLIGKYRIDEKISEGGMGAVYRGTHVLMDKTVAIKVLRPSLAADEKIVARFSREARAASRITHPNALSVNDFGEAEDGIVFLVMEFLSGKTLKEVIRDQGPMSLERVVEIIRQVADALKAAHDQGVVHRDLKSDNIMLTSTAVGEHAKVLDFGIAKINEPNGVTELGLTAPNLVIGTPQYMSPEQCSQASEIDSRSDIYSLGVILYEMLVGHVPFGGESPTMVMLKQMQEPVPSVLEERDDIPASLEHIISRAMAKIPGNRYQTVTDLLEDLMIAAGMPMRPVSAASNTEENRQQTNAATPETDEDDELTVVRPREEPDPHRRAPLTVPIAPQAAVSAFKPARILIPAALAVLVVFAGIYVFTQDSTNAVDANSNVNQPGLAADPNSLPVQAASPPSGRDEADIPSGGKISPANQNVNANVSPTPPEDTASPTPSINANTNSNNNREAPLPPPTRTASPIDIPLPSPPNTNTPAPKSSPAVPNPTPTAPPN